MSFLVDFSVNNLKVTCEAFEVLKEHGLLEQYEDSHPLRRGLQVLLSSGLRNIAGMVCILEHHRLRSFGQAWPAPRLRELALGPYRTLVFMEGERNFFGWL